MVGEAIVAVLSLGPGEAESGLRATAAGAGWRTNGQSPAPGNDWA